MNLNQVTIPSLNVVKSVEFYKTLGLQLIVDAAPRYVRFLCPDGDTTFSIHKVEKLSNDNQTIIYFEVDNLTQTVEMLKQKGIAFNTEITEQSWLWKEIRLKDPDHNQIIIYTAGENRKNPPWRI
ncbi:glyoxalase/bleomycin resistance/extradiol dioxygenase family protein [Winogradskyella sp. J14-2]|uniref:VOC family protein n=1 Tax=Winogradskyella sp. J14-2 TaxID=1936080 RepID=UPI00097277D4|nr:VOC family protein [Winogradskyella sp. J14-2]APY09134.1 glyoxalase/bleomycin resistance/extradiol dioxygenase family protein [Winogradskyella sp. J14-2]